MSCTYTLWGVWADVCIVYTTIGDLTFQDATLTEAACAVTHVPPPVLSINVLTFFRLAVNLDTRLAYLVICKLLDDRFRMVTVLRMGRRSYSGVGYRIDPGRTGIRYE